MPDLMGCLSFLADRLIEMFARVISDTNKRFFSAPAIRNLTVANALLNCFK